MIQPQHLMIFAAGLILGLILLPVLGRLFDPRTLHRFFDALGRAVTLPFQRVTRLFRKGSGRGGMDPSSEPPIDPREQQIHDSAYAIRSMLLVLADAVQRIDQAANSSSLALNEVRGAVNVMGLPQDLAQTAAHLLSQIDRVIASNSSLRNELANTQEVLNEQKQLIESLRTAVRVDKMTQFASRSYFDDKIAEMIKLKKRYGDVFFLMIIDVDNFKSINDNFGHQGGDRILKGVAFKIRSTLRDSDFVARYGGDEFALIVIKSTRSAATSLAWKLCQQVRDSRFILDSKEVTVTLSIGLAEAAAEDSVESLLKRADAALYLVKEAGRNGVLFAESPAPRAPVSDPSAPG